MPSSLVWTIGLCPLLRLGGTLEPVEVVIPEVLQVVAQLIEGLAARAVEPTRPLPALMQQIGVLEHAQVLRDGRPTDVEVRGDLSGAQLIVGGARINPASIGAHVLCRLRIRSQNW